MKKSSDPRHLKRVRRFKNLFAKSFISPAFNQEVDAIIIKNAPEWPINKLNKVDLAILRLAITELKSLRQAPTKVIIDEAIEIGKKFGTAKTPKFINGVLGSLIKNEA